MTANEQPVANLRAARTEQAKRRHPAGSALPAKALANKATPKPLLAVSASNKTAAPKLRWHLHEERKPGKAAVPQTATYAGHQWMVTQAEGGWTVTHKAPSGRETILTEKPVSYASAYRVAVEAAKAVAA